MQSLKKKIYFVTGNPKKLKEFKAIVGDSYQNVEFEIKDVDLPEIQGQPEEVALTKCRLAAQKCDSPVIVQDTSLCYNALKGLPGPYIKFFLSKLGTDGLFKILHGFDDKSAYAQCIFAYAANAKSDVKLFPGRTMGKIVEPRGPGKFGWDPVFQPDGFQQTFAEMDPEVKNSISHRFRALQKLKDFFQKEF